MVKKTTGRVGAADTAIRSAVGRELAMIELRRQVNALDFAGAPQ
ncbi:MAG: hypothetical protein Q7J42_08285 [Sulfuritalea sp.]|nr:hypothetical protein [Sulfuritalea sp.]